MALKLLVETNGSRTLITYKQWRLGMGHRISAWALVLFSPGSEWPRKLKNLTIPESPATSGEPSK